MPTHRVGILKHKRSFGAVNLPVKLASSARVSSNVCNIDDATAICESAVEGDVVVCCLGDFAVGLPSVIDEIVLGAEVCESGGNILDLAESIAQCVNRVTEGYGYQIGASFHGQAVEKALWNDRTKDRALENRGQQQL